MAKGQTTFTASTAAQLVEKAFQADLDWTLDHIASQAAKGKTSCSIGFPVTKFKTRIIAELKSRGFRVTGDWVSW